MGRGIEYKVVSYVMLDGQPHEFDKLEPETRSKCVRKMLDNMGKTLSDYYSAHTEEVPALMEQPFVEVVRMSRDGRSPAGSGRDTDSQSI